MTDVSWQLLEEHDLGGQDVVTLETRFMPTGRQFRVVRHWRVGADNEPILAFIDREEAGKVYWANCRVLDRRIGVGKTAATLGALPGFGRFA